MSRKMSLLREIFEETRVASMRRRDFQSFVRRAGEWLAPYALFCALRDAFGTASIDAWPAELADITTDDIDELTAPGSKYFDDVAVTTGVVHCCCRC
jgi:4-alpha-glucanotransferase